MGRIRWLVIILWIFWAALFILNERFALGALRARTT
jgi:hypothetical protein